MAEILGQATPSAGVETLLATVATAKDAVCHLHACCVGAAADVFRVRVRPAGVSLGVQQYLYHWHPIAGNRAHETTIGITLAAGDRVYVESLLGHVAFHLWGDVQPERGDQSRRVLGQAAPSAATWQTLLTVGADLEATLSCLFVCCRAGVADTFSVRVVPSGETPGDGHLTFDAHPVAGRRSHEITEGISLATGDLIQVRSESGTCSFSAFGALGLPIGALEGGGGGGGGVVLPISMGDVDGLTDALALKLEAADLSAYETTSHASSTYQTIAGMAAYVTAASLTSTLAGYVTTGALSTALSGYLTTSAAASTYQTQAAMSAYLTTASAASTYQTQSGMSAYVTAADFDLLTAGARGLGL